MKALLFLIAIVLAGLSGAFVGSIGYVGVTAKNSAEASKQAAVALVEEVSRTWSIEGSRDIFTPTAMTQATSQKGKQALAVMSRLGRLLKASEVTQTGYQISWDEGTTVSVSFRGVFENGSSDVTVVLREETRLMKIVELDLKKIWIRPVNQQRAAV